MRGGFSLGFLAGAVAAALMSPPRAEAPGERGEIVDEAGESAPTLLAKARRQLREARIAALEAAAAKEAELRRTLDEAIKRRE